MDIALNYPELLIDEKTVRFEAHTLIENNYDQTKALNSRVLIHLLTLRELQIAFPVPIGKYPNFRSLFGWPELMSTMKMRSMLRLDTYLITFFRTTEATFNKWMQWTKTRHAVAKHLENAAVYCIVNKEYSHNCRPTCSPTNFTPSPFNDHKFNIQTVGNLRVFTPSSSTSNGNDKKSFAEQLTGDLRIHLKHPEWPLFQCDNLYWPLECLYYDFSARRDCEFSC
jgi:hypothetical protein